MASLLSAVQREPPKGPSQPVALSSVVPADQQCSTNGLELPRFQPAEHAPSSTLE